MSKSNNMRRQHAIQSTAKVAAETVENGDKPEGTDNEAPAGEGADASPPHGADGDSQAGDQPQGTEGEGGEAAETQEAGEPEAVAASQSKALRHDTKIAARSTAADKAVTTELGEVAVVTSNEGLTLAKEGSVRAAAKGVLYVAPLAYLVGPGNVEPSAKSAQHQLAVAALRKLQGDDKMGLVDLHAVQRTYMDLGGTDLTIFTGRTRLYTTGGKAPLVKSVAQAPMAVYLAPAPVVAPSAPVAAPAAEAGQEVVAA